MRHFFYNKAQVAADKTRTGMRRPLLLEMQSAAVLREHKVEENSGHPGVEFYLEIIHKALQQSWRVTRSGIDCSRDYHREIRYFDNRDKAAVRDMLIHHLSQARLYATIDQQVKKYPQDVHAFCESLVLSGITRKRTVVSLQRGLQHFLCASHCGDSDRLLQVFFVYMGLQKRQSKLTVAASSHKISDVPCTATTMQSM